MKILVLFVLLISSLLSYDEEKATKFLSSLGRAEVYVATLVQRNELKEATRFLQEVLKKYKESFELLYWQGELHLENGELDLAESYFRQALVLKKNHELTRKKIEYIQEQKEAKENNSIEELLSLVNDKGLDFLMIFLAFLGGEIIAKRYNICKNNSIHLIALHYINREKLSQSLIARFIFTFKHVIPKKFSVECLTVNFLVLTTISISILVPILFIEFHWGITFILNEPMLTMDSDSVELHVEKMFILFLFISFIGMYIFRTFSLPKESHIYEIEFIEELDGLLERRAYSDIYEVLIDVGVLEGAQDIKKLMHLYSSDPQRLCNYFQNDKSCHTI